MNTYKEYIEVEEEEDNSNSDGDKILRSFDPGDQKVSKLQNVMARVPILRKAVKKTCFEDIGCFPLFSYNNSASIITLDLLPMPPGLIQPKFLLFTPENTATPYTFNYKANAIELKKSYFNAKYRTVIITHGYRSDLEPYLLTMKDFIFSQLSNSYNVIIVTWGKGAKVPLYFLAAANTKVVGALIAFFINRLCETYNITNQYFHLIGHSLGAQVVGFAGKRLYNPKVARITALDPAGPGFRDDMRVGREDASIVDVVHTDMADINIEGLGVNENIGHYDFYPNGGKLQPGCPASAGILNFINAMATGESISCSHSRAYEFIVALGRPGQSCLPVGYKCMDWETFLEGRCGECDEDLNKCYLMGLYLLYWRRIRQNEENNEDYQTSDTKYYLNTAADEDYCLFHYQFGIHVSNDSASLDLPGDLEITLFHSNGTKSSFDLIIKRKMSSILPGFIHTMLVTFRYEIQSIEKVEIVWKHTVVKKVTSFKTKQITIPTTTTTTTTQYPFKNVIRIDFLEINYMSHIEEKYRKSKSFLFCPISEGSLVVGGKAVEFYQCNDGIEPEAFAKNLPYSQLHPLTAREDILAVDYDMYDKVPHKLERSNYIKKSLLTIN